MTNQNKINEILIHLAEYYFQELSEAQVKMFTQDLRGMTPEQVQEAAICWRRNPRNTRFPLPVQLKQAVPDGRPSTNEAWAMIPKTEHGSVVWCEEMRLAFGVAYKLLNQGEKQAAFFAFKDKYEELVADARGMGVQPEWSPSFGFDKVQRTSAIKDAVAHKRLNQIEANKMLPIGAPNNPGLKVLADSVFRRIEETK